MPEFPQATHLLFPSYTICLVSVQNRKNVFAALSQNISHEKEDSVMRVIKILSGLRRRQ